MIGSGPFLPPLTVLCDQVRGVATKLSLGSGAYQLLRLGSNVVLRNEVDGVLARVAADYMTPDYVATKLAAARHLVALGMPILGPLHNQVVQLESGSVVTFWPLAEADVQPDGHDFASLATACHRLEPPAGLEQWTPQFRLGWRRAQLRLGADAGAPASLVDRLEFLLWDRQHRLEATYAGLEIKSRVLHGDFYHGNIIRWRDRLLLCDPDNLCQGSPEKDLASIYFDCHRIYHHSDYWDQFVRAYPLAYNQSLLDCIIKTQEVGDCIWLLSLWGTRPESHRELASRLATIDDPDARWTAL